MTDEMKTRIETAMKNLKRNNMDAYLVNDKEEAVALIKNLVPQGATVTCGGSVTLKETGVYDLISSDYYHFLDRSACQTQDEVEEIYRKGFSADAFFTSSNAVTENGELYNVDGNSNRVAMILYGPKSVICVCGVNKLVKNIDEAVRRVKTKAAPPNTVRLHCETPCAKTGECISLRRENPELCEGCRSSARICCNYVVCAQQRHINRIKVIFIDEELGY